MKPVMQTEFGLKGNCFMACVASITEIPLEELPNLYDDADQMGESWWEVTVQALTERGWIICWYDTDGDSLLTPPGWAIANGLSPRGTLSDKTDERIRHSVVVFDGEMNHDPHPDCTWLDGPADGYYIMIKTASND